MQNVNDLFIQEETNALEAFKALTQDQLKLEAMQRKLKAETYNPEIDHSSDEGDNDDCPND
jgi:hypothetical protein